MADTRRTNTKRNAGKRNGAAPAPALLENCAVPSAEELLENLRKVERLEAAIQVFEELSDEGFISNVVQLIRLRVEKVRGLRPPIELFDQSEVRPELRGLRLGKVQERLAPKAVHDERREEDPRVHWVDPQDARDLEDVVRVTEAVLREGIGGEARDQVRNLGKDALRLARGASLDTRNIASENERIRDASSLIESYFYELSAPGQDIDRLAQNLAVELFKRFGNYPATVADPVAVARNCLSGETTKGRCVHWARHAFPVNGEADMSERIATKVQKALNQVADQTRP